MKQVIISGPILVYPNPIKQENMFSDSSIHSWSGILMQYHDQVKEDETIVYLPFPRTYRNSTFQGSQKNRSALTREAYVICMSLCILMFFLKDAYVKIRCNHAPLCKLIYSVTKNDKVNNWSQKYM